MTDREREQLATAGFTDGRRYDDARPSYPLDAVAYLADQLLVRDAELVVDVGAGTGIFTRLIAEHCERVVAVEPSAGMREAFDGGNVEVTVLDGRDTALPFDNCSVDVLTVAQAFHWFNAPEALAEFSRVLRPGGRVGLIWNERDESVTWVSVMSKAMLWDSRQPYVVGMDFTSVLEAGHFTDVHRREFSYVQRLSRSGLDQRVLTTSYIALMNESQQRAILADVATVVDGLGQPIELPYVTTTYVATRG